MFSFSRSMGWLNNADIIVFSRQNDTKREVPVWKGERWKLPVSCVASPVAVGKGGTLSKVKNDPIITALKTIVSTFQKTLS